MKKTLLISLLTIFTATALISQEKIQFGIKGGMNLTNMTSEFVIDKEFRTGFHIGLLTEIPFGNILSLQAEILYSTYGSKGKMIMLGGPAQPIAYNLDYIQIPVLAKIYIIENLSLEIGPSFNFITKNAEIFNSLTINDIGESFEISGALGLSYKTNSGFFASLRYTKGYTNALQGVSRDEKNYGFFTGIGYLF